MFFIINLFLTKTPEITENLVATMYSFRRRRSIMMERVRATIFSRTPLSIRGGGFLAFLVLIIVFYKTGCDTPNQGVIDPSYNSPYLISMSVLPEIINTDTITTGGQTSPNDEIDVSWDVNLTIDRRGTEHFSIAYQLTNPRLTQSLAENIYSPSNNLTDDTLAISFRVSAKITRSDIGKYIFESKAVTDNGLASNSRLSTVELIRTNQPPVILFVSAPDTLVLPDPINGEPVNKLFEISVEVDDPNGVEDVTSVYFFSYNPAGQRGDVPFFLNKIQNGIFADTLTVNSTNTKGTYRFEFQARDRSNALSDPVNHYITLE
jgi:hypothetical protein